MAWYILIYHEIKPQRFSYDSSTCRARLSSRGGQRRAGAGQTLVPTIINFGTMWLVRIGLALFLTPRYGLTGYWIAMCVELSFRGILFLVYVKSGHWLKKWAPSPSTLDNPC